MDLLGWKIKKRDEIVPSPVFTALGVEFSLADAVSSSMIAVRNKQARVDEDVATIEGLLASGQVHPGAAWRLRGRLLFAASQTFGRCGAMALRALSDLAEGKGGPVRLGVRESMALQWWIAHLRRSPPRRVPLGVEALPILIFTDGGQSRT